MAANRGTSTWMKEKWGKPCTVDLVTIPIYAGGPRFTCHKLAREAFLALGHVFQKYGYIVRSIGSFNCRPNTSNPKIPSNHSWGTAIDVNPATNPYSPRHINKLITDMSYHMIQEIKKIKTIGYGGKPVFRWGGDYVTVKDAMHFDIIVTPTEILTGINFGVGSNIIATTWPVIRIGSKSKAAVLQLQQLLNKEYREYLVVEDGIFGKNTEALVINYQESRGLVVDGVVGAATWTALFNKIPPISVTNVSPTKHLA